MGNAQTRSMARTNMFVRIAYPVVAAGGAITTAGNLSIGGNARISGGDSLPPAWSRDSTRNGNCAGMTQRDTFVVAAGLLATVDSSSRNLIGSGTNNDSMRVSRSAINVDSNTYVRYGSETWESLRRNADVFIPAGADVSPFPAGTDSTCNYADRNNWGEPHRSWPDTVSTSTYVAGCRGYFPIVYVDGNLHVNRQSRGQGILLVNGDLTFNGGFEWNGLIIVRDDIERGNGNAEIYGSIMSRNADLSDRSSDLRGTTTIRYSRCALENALRGSAILIPAKHRSWAQFF